MKLDLEEINQKYIGSSETTREASVFNFDRALYTTTPQPSKKVKQNKTLFFEWFLGFTEGDGSFVLAKFPTKAKPNNKRPYFVISQKDPRVLFTIKKELGFGKIISVSATENHDAYFRYVVSKLAHIQWLILLFNGNLLMSQGQKSFGSWLEHFNDLIYRKKDGENGVDWEVWAPIQLKPFTKESITRISLKSAWLAGFVDADGGFYASLSKNKRYKLGFRERYKFYIPQKGERWLLARIGEVIKEATCLKFGEKKSSSKGDLITSYSEKVTIFRLEIFAFSQLKSLIDYFDNYFLLSKQQLVFVRWKRLVLGREQNKQAALKGEKGMARLLRKFDSIGKIRDVVPLNTQKQIQELNSTSTT